MSRETLADSFFNAPMNIAVIIEWIEAETLDPEDLFFFLIGSKCQGQVVELRDALNERNINGIGGVFYKVFKDNEIHDDACVVMRLAGCAPPVLVEGLCETAVSLEQLPAGADLLPGTSLLLLIDSRSTESQDFISRVYDRYGNRVSYLGGGAGLTATYEPADYENQAWVFTTAGGAIEKSAAVAFIKTPLAVAARHGWKRKHGPLVATRAEGNHLLELNWRPAFDVYKELYEEEYGEELTTQGIRDFQAIKFPLGVQKSNAEDLVRLPSEHLPGGGLLCLGGVHNNSVLYTLTGGAEDLFEAAAEAGRASEDALEIPVREYLVFDCVTRYLFLEEAFKQEIKAVSSGSLSNSSGSLSNSSDQSLPPVYGALAEGELASGAGGYVEMMAKTIAVGALGT